MTERQHHNLAALFRAISTYDTVALSDLLVPDACLLRPGSPAEHGPDGAERMINDFAREYTEFSIAPHRAIVENDAAMAEWTATITDFGGGQTRVDGCAVVDFEGEKVSRLRLYYRPEDTRA